MFFPPVLRTDAERPLDMRALLVWGGVFFGHVILAQLMLRMPTIGLLHATACVGIGIVIAVRRPLHEVAYVVAYIAGSEVLWRMTRAGVFWEFGKYAVSAVLLVALVRARGKRNRALAIGYFGLLVPSAVLTILALDFNIARQQVSFNLSGPLCLMLSILFFSNLRLTADQLRHTFFSLIAPVLGIAGIAYFSTIAAVDLEFNGQSNSVTSGGFGPNQVSAMLGLALLFLIMTLFDRREVWRIKWPLLVLAILVATQTALTFSRGGLALAFSSAFVMALYLMRQRRARITLLVVGTLLFAVGKYVIVPRLDSFTEGKFSQRYVSTKTSNRALLAGYDIDIFVDNPVLGVGPGVASGMRGELGHFGAAHTEFTRMLAEHGILGVASVFLLFVLAVRTIANARTLHARALVSAMLVWFALFLLVNAMRLAAPAFLFGLACSIAYSSMAARGPPRNP
jgi:O-antigen ligase